MKNLKLTALLSFIILSLTNYVTAQKNLVNNPCGEKEKGVNVRLTNADTSPITKFLLIVHGKKYVFDRCDPGETTCYKNLPYIYTENSYDIESFRSPGNGFNVQWRPNKRKKNPKIKNGNYTLTIISHKKYNAEAVLKPEK
jgi:hypothetical protein